MCQVKPTRFNVHIQSKIVYHTPVMGTQSPVTERKGNVLFNDALDTFYLRLYGVRHMVKDQSDSERGNQLPPHELLFPISSKQQ